MKKLPLSFVLCLLSFGFSAFAAEQELCEVGVTAINSPLTNTIVAVSYDDLGSDSGMVVSNLVKTTNLTAGDTLAVFNNSKTYDTWVLTEGAGGVKYWAKQAKTYTVDGNGQLTVGTGDSAAATVLGVGTGLWLTRKDVSKPFYIYGKPATSKSVTVAAKSWALVGNPTQESVTIGTDKVITASNNDQIVAFGTNDKLWYYTYRLKGKANEGWYTTDSEGEWVKASPTIDAGLGFWIRLNEGTTIVW